ncbi:hypothetical protein F4809DRAFT_636046 [Biscogniauxia mediterranea]|nr:hypothetical protein F4809DRAFT_636046 [Biscogniauxia mediterranea]
MDRCQGFVVVVLFFLPSGYYYTTRMRREREEMGKTSGKGKRVGLCVYIRFGSAVSVRCGFVFFIGFGWEYPPVDLVASRSRK